LSVLFAQLLSISVPLETGLPDGRLYVPDALRGIANSY
jgi:hypothetical protein